METHQELKQQYSLPEILERVQSAKNPNWALFALSLDNASKKDADLPEIMRACAIPRRFDQRIIGILRDSPDEEDRNAQLLDLVCSYSFVTRREDCGHVYSDGIREAVLEDWHSTDEKRQQFAEISNRLAQYYEDEHDRAREWDEDLARVSSVMRNANLARYRNLDALVKKKLLQPLLEALHHRLLASTEDGFSFFQNHFHRQEEMGRLLACQSLISATRDFLLRLPTELQDPKQAVWLDYFEARILRQLPSFDYPRAEEQFRSLSRREDLGTLFRLWVLNDLAIVQEAQEKLRDALSARKELWALAEQSGEDVYNWPIYACNLGKLYWRLGELDHAIEHYRTAIETSDSKEKARRDMSVYGRCDLSGLYCEAGQWNRGIESGVEALYLARTEFSDSLAIQNAVACRLMRLLLAFDQDAAEAAAAEYMSLSCGIEQRELAAHAEYIEALDSAGRTGFAASQLLKLRVETEQSERPQLFRPTLLFREAWAYDGLGRHEESITKYDELLGLSERGLVTNWDKAAALSNRGQLLTVEGRWESAEEDLRAALGLWEIYGHETLIAFVHVLLADLKRCRGLLSDAQEELDRAAKVLDAGIRSYRDEFHVVQGDVYFAQGKWKEAREHLGLAYEFRASCNQRQAAVRVLQKLCEVTVEEADWESASEFATRAAQKCCELATLNAYRPSAADEEANKKNAEGVRLFCEGSDINEACELFRSAQEQVPSNFWYQMNLAFAKAKRGHWLDASQALEDALRMAPEPMRTPRLYRCWRDFLVAYAESNYKQGNISKAISGIEGTLRLVDPFLPAEDLIALRVRLGDYLWSAGRSDEARQAYTVALQHAESMYLEHEQLQLAVRRAILNTADDQLSDAISSLKLQLARMDAEEKQSLTNVFTEIADLIQFPQQFHAVADLMRALSTAEGITREVVEIVNEQLFDLISQHYRPVMYPLSRLKPPSESAYTLLPVVTPIALEMDVSLAPTDDAPGIQWMLEKGLPDLRERVLKDMGVCIPGVRVRANENVSPGGYFHSLFDAPLYSYTVYEGKRFCPKGAKCREIGLSGLDAENYGLSGGNGLWLDESQWAKAEAVGLPLWDPYEYMTFHTESVVRAHLSSFFGVQELRNTLDDWLAGITPFDTSSQEQMKSRQMLVDEAVRDDRGFQRLLRVLRALLHENVPILRLERILAEFVATEAEEVRDVGDVVERIRMVLREDLPGNRDHRTIINIPEELESPLLSGVHRQDGKVFFAFPAEQVQDFLSEVRNILPQTPGIKPALVVSMAEVRPLASALLVLEFPNLPVLASRELVTVE